MAESHRLGSRNLEESALGDGSRHALGAGPYERRRYDRNLMIQRDQFVER